MTLLFPLSRHAVASTLCLALAILPLGVRAAEGAPEPAEPRITLIGSDLMLISVLTSIARSAHLALVIDKDVKTDRKVSPSLEDLPLSSALAVVLTPMGYSSAIEPRTKQLRVFVYDTRTFKVAIPIVQQSWEASISNEGGASGGGGAAPAGGGGAAGAPQAGAGGAGGLGARVSLRTRSDTQGLWEEVERSLARMIGENPELGSYSVNRVAGFATVRAPPPLMTAVASYFDALNAEMGRSISIETRVLQVDFNTKRSIGLDWNLVMQRLGGLGMFVDSVTVPSSIQPPGSTFFRLSGRGGEAMLRALEEQGNVNLVAQPTLVLGNNLPAIIEVGTVQAYVAQQTTTVAQGGIAQIAVQTSSINDGLVLSILPRLMEDGQVALALGTVLQEILEIRKETFAGGFVELPRTSRRTYNGVVKARAGETLVIGGLVSTRKETKSSGLPFLSKLPFVGWLFGTQQVVDLKSELVITITPQRVTGVPVEAR
jgi:MSHA biogenesis protein MshL